MRFPFPWTLVSSDGVQIRTIHAAALSPEQRAVMDAVLCDVFLLAPAPPPPPAPVVEDQTLTQAEIARTKGFSGNSCGNCGSFNLVRTGTCETCQDCGQPSGGCS